MPRLAGYTNPVPPPRALHGEGGEREGGREREERGHSIMGQKENEGRKQIGASESMPG